MNCKLCDKPIECYDPASHHLKIDNVREVDICTDCADTIIAWQGRRIASLFPTRAMKRLKEKRGY